MKETQSEGIPFYIVDVFTESKYGGNQLAVVISEGKLSDGIMQKIANEMNYSETTFITSIENYDVRIFTPKVELPFAGHPTIGTAFIIQQMYIKQKVKTISLNLKIGSIATLFKYKGDFLSEVWMEHKNPTFHGFFAPEILAEVLNLSETDFDGRFKIQEVSTGIPTIIVPLKTLDAVKRALINRDKYFELIMKTQSKSILIFCPETYDKKNNLNVRFFADYYGVPEDPATGSANGCLAAYLVKYQYFGKDRVNISVEQGYEMGRESILFLRAEEKGGKFFVAVGGKVILVAKGMLL